MSKEEQNYQGALDQLGGGKVDTPKKQFKNGWQAIHIELLSYLGKFYPENSVISVRPFSTKEVIYFTSINEDNPLELDKAMRYLVNECVQCQVGNRIVKSEDFLYNNDRFPVILLARLYSDMRTDLTFEHTCTSETCDHKQKVKIIPQNLVFTKDLISKYFNAESGVFEINMKSSEGIEKLYVYSPITVKENKDLFEFIMDKRNDIDESELKVMAKLFPFMRNYMEGVKNMEDVYGKFKDLTKYEIADMAKLNDKVVLEAVQKIDVECKECGHKEGVPMRFPNGFGAIVLDKDEDDDFLL